MQGRDSRAIKSSSKDVIDDVANDFNDDEFSIYDALGKGRGNLTDEARAKNNKKGMKAGAYGGGIDDDDEGGYGSSGYRGNFIFT